MFRFYEVFDECKKIVFSKQFQVAIQKEFNRPPLNSFINAKEILAFMKNSSNQTCLGEVRRNEILKELIEIHQERSVQTGLESLLLVLFKPVLLKLFCRYRRADFEGDEVGQVLFASFLEVIGGYSLSERPEKIAKKIVHDTKEKVSEWISRKNRRSEFEVQEDEELPETERACDRGPENALVIMLDLANGFGYDETTDRLCTRIKQLHEKGVINDIEKKILIGRLVYRKTLSELVPRREYEKWKKQMQRLNEKIKHELTG